MTGVVMAAGSAPVADLLTAACILALIVFGGQRGLFLATAAALVVLTAFFAALAFGPEAASMLESFGVPAGYCLAGGCIVTAAVVAGACRVALDGLVQDDDVRWGGRIDKVGGALVGAVAGVLLAGAVQVAWSMLDLPPTMRLDPAALRLDAGTRMLAAFVRGVQIDPVERKRLLDGGLCPECAASDAGTPRLLASEPFDDVNGNGGHDDGEPYLDEDRSGGFTADRPIARRAGATAEHDEHGLLARYRLAAWQRIRRMHAPQMTSPGSAPASLPPEPDAAEVVYRITAEDLDGGTLTYAIDQPGDGDGPKVEVDSASGEVRLRPRQTPEAGRVRFVARVTDATGLQDEKPVTITLTSKPD